MKSSPKRISETFFDLSSIPTIAGGLKAGLVNMSGPGQHETKRAIYPVGYALHGMKMLCRPPDEDPPGEKPCEDLPCQEHCEDGGEKYKKGPYMNYVSKSDPPLDLIQQQESRSSPVLAGQRNFVG